ncbi:replication-relaxation family protein [Pseudoalteromonas phenolica]|nr:replication-relaxation family protein [Pseudoalteromonas phenolica]
MLNSLIRENEILYSLSRFGWLTHHQITNLLCPSAKSSSDSIRKILKRLTSDGYTYENSIRRSPVSQCKSYSLTRKGMNRVAEIDGLRRSIRNNSVTRKQMNEKYEFHRLVANQTLIDLRHNRLNLPVTIDQFISEHEVGTLRNAFASHFGCVPDGVGISGNKLIMIEVENSVRGPLRHGSKLTHWLETFTDRVYREKKFTDHFLPLGKAGEYDDVIQLFICTSQKNFRSIWRKVEKVMQQNRIYSHVFYLVADKQYWVEPLRHAQFMEHNEQQTKALIAATKR